MNLIHTPFGFGSTAAEVAAGADLSGRRAVVTGASSGLGVETARALAGTGAEVTLAVRDVAAGERAAAGIAGSVRVTPLGRELQFATNHLGHFALATGLHDALAADGAARIVVVSSSGHQLSPVVFDDVDFAFRPYDPWLAYGQSKTANVLFAVEATRRWAGDGITANALMPGAIHTNLQRHTGGRGSGQVPPELIKTPEQGAATSVLLATSPLL